MITDRPVAKSSLDLMAGEIKLGQLYLTQSEQLREQLSNDRYHTHTDTAHYALRPLSLVLNLNYPSPS